MKAPADSALWLAAKIVMYFAIGLTLGRLLGGCSRGGDDPDAAVAVCDPPCELGDECYRGMCLPRTFCGIEWCASEEVCNGIDDDQDGLTDESPTGAPLSRYCMAECGTGAEVCLAGFWGPCRGPEPVPEVGTLCRDGVDNDCDGATDETPEHPVDVALLIDRSGSMSDDHAAILANVSAFAATADPGWRWAVVVFPGTYPSGWDIAAPLGPWADTEPVLRSLWTRGSSEGSYDVLLAAGTDTLGLSWRGGTRLVFLFTDEPGQSYGVPRATEESACGSFTRGEVVVIFTTTPGDFDACGTVRHLTDVPSITLDLVDPCAR